MPLRLRFSVVFSCVALVVAACGGPAADIATIPELPAVTTESVVTVLASSDRPVLLNVWASWCVPCRSEAPLLEAAFAEFGTEVEFIGLNVRDTQDGARGFIAEFGRTTEDGAAITHLFDAGGNIPVELGGNRGVPLTFFYAAGGELVHMHPGVIDERTLALQIDELLARSG